ncbi:Pimeloyl-ACP methyl ester carboxylesterase [Arachidicoccus rhizosphaerae]|uniref:Pimeloyl-ACP methyl ester carboxylesterase n=1 Tax=Arachidicoccus rhizosphaerae TaxID=551991 RepID=A0A1H4B4H9_9BACT|nr:alpha/beta hydrolase [Arachidicoccus rhizosphaerae]SEA42924.1 Pimeloyl-ACP methyl ester carboxylesterase [Arachidicoccus rhizosphaerae]
MNTNNQLNSLGNACHTTVTFILTLFFTILGITASHPGFARQLSQVNQDSTLQIKAGKLEVGYAVYGPQNGQPVILLHGWPYGIESYKESSRMLAAKGYRVYVPYARGFGSTTFLSDTTTRSGEPAALAQDLLDFMDALHIKKAILGGFDWGARTADIIAALYPERCTALVAVSGYLIGDPKSSSTPLPPKAELAWWYQFYFATQRGEQGYKENTHDFAKLIWQLASPDWHFSQATFDKEAKALDNPDHVAITIHNYRYRLQLTAADPCYRQMEAKINALPDITVPTVTLEGDANGAPHPQPAAYRNKFTGKYDHHTIQGGIGHDLPKEAPAAFAAAIIQAAHLAE